MATGRSLSTGTLLLLRRSRLLRCQPMGATDVEPLVDASRGARAMVEGREGPDAVLWFPALNRRAYVSADLVPLWFEREHDSAYF